MLEPEHALRAYNEVAPVDHEQRPLADFAQEIVRTFEERKLERVIVDVRSNGGGNNTTFPPLIHALQSTSIDRPGVLYGLIGRATFSAAGNFVTVLQRDTKAILVGEPTGGAPNQYGGRETVPHGPASPRGTTFGGPKDERLTHEPALAVPLRSGTTSRAGIPSSAPRSTIRSRAERRAACAVARARPAGSGPEREG